MSPFFFKTKTKKHHTNSRQNIFKKFNFKQGASIFLSILFVLTVGFYLFQINDLAIKGFEIRSLEKKIKEFGQSNKNLELKVADMQALSNIEDLKKELNMVKVSKVEYISSSQSVVIRQ